MADRLHAAPDETNGLRFREGEAPGRDQRDGGGPHCGKVLRVEDRDRYPALAVVNDDDPADVGKAAGRVPG